MDQPTPTHEEASSAGSLQQALRTVGLGLDVSKVRRAELRVDAAGIDVQTQSDYGHRMYAWDDLQIQSRVQRPQRRPGQRPPPWLNPTALTRWSVLLRIVGQLLDAKGVRDCVIDAAVAPLDEPEACMVRVTEGGHPVAGIDAESVRFQLRRLRTRYAEAPEAPVAVPRPWWAFWRRD